MASCVVEHHSQEKVVQQLNELFGNVLNLDVIKKVAVSCEYDVYKSSNKLLEITSTTEKKPDIEMNNLSKVISVEVGNSVVSNGSLTKFSSESLLSAKKSKKALEVDQAIKLVLKGYKVLIIMRGLPGSGKSYLSKQILESTIGYDSNHNMHILSTDDFFTQNPQGIYMFNSSMLPDAHNWNQRRAFESLRRGFSPVIIDNTNIQMWEMQPYATMAIDYGYIIQIVEPDTHWCFNDKELTKRNRHGVSKTKIVDMLCRYDKNVTAQKLLSAYNLSYRFQKPPQLRLYPPLNIGFSNSTTTLNNNIDQSDIISSSYNTFATDVQSTDTKNTVEIIDLMEFNDEDDVSNIRKNESMSFSRFNGTILSESKPKTLDEILMISNDSTNNILQPEHNTDVISIDSDDELSNQSNKPLFPNIETAWGINESYLRSWDIVSPIEDSGNLISFPSNYKVTKQVITSNASCNTDEKDFEMIKCNSSSIEGLKILHTVNRDINRATPKKEPKIPFKQTVDKSCMTQDIYDDFENHLQDLKNLFPSIPETHLTYWYNKCKGDIEWTIEFLLEAEDPQIYIDENMIAIEKSEVKHLQESKQSHDQEIRSVEPDNSPKGARSKKSSKNKYDDVKKVIESKIDINPNNYSKHLLRIKNFKFNNNNKSIDIQASTSTESKIRKNSLSDIHSRNDVILIDSDPEFEEMDMDILEKNEEPEKMVELNLGDNFVSQLETQFGDPGIEYPKGFQPVVQVPISLARQLYTFYVESVFQQMETQKQIMEDLTKEDEEFARKLQEKEQGQANTSATQTMSFKEIMEEQEQLSQLQKESEKWKTITPDNLAALLTRQKLFKSFPTIEQETLLEILHANDNKYGETVESLLASIGAENINGSVEVVKEPPIKDDVLDEMREAQKSSTCEDYTEVRQGTFYREEANRFFKKRTELYQKAQQYIQKGMHEVAQFYSSLASQQTSYLERANSLAATAFLDEHSKRLEDFNTLDLHFLHVKEAIHSLDVFVDRNINLLKLSEEKQFEYLHIITGRGKNSENGVAKLRPVIMAHLNKRKIRFGILNPGLLKIKVTKKSLLSIEIS